MLKNHQTDNIIIFSETLEGRDYLRNWIMRLGLNAVCFEKEAICFDNFRSISPKIVIVQTEENRTIWRFICAAHAMDLECPLLIVSQSLKAGAYLNYHAEQYENSDSERLHSDSLMRQILDLFNGARIVHVGTHQPLFVGEVDAVRKIRSQLPSIAESSDPVLITGEPGTGKELLVRLINRMAKGDRNLVKIDCSELEPEMLINGWLDAVLATGDESKPATLFFNNIHLVSKQIQSEILLVIDRLDILHNRKKTVVSKDSRIIAACEPVIQERLRGDGFRKDLFYRLNVIPIHVPPLRDRKDDIPLLMDYFTIEFCADSQKSIMIPSKKARDTLHLYHWPGNVDELKTYMRRIAAAGNESCIFDNHHIPKPRNNTREYFFRSAGAENLPNIHEIKNSLSDMRDISLRKVCEEFVTRTEKRLMQKALETTNWNRKKAAQLLNISYKSMLNKIKAYDIA